jgi:hypothetical protein
MSVQFHFTDSPKDSRTILRRTSNWQRQLNLTSHTLLRIGGLSLWGLSKCCVTDLRFSRSVACHVVDPLCVETLNMPSCIVTIISSRKCHNQVIGCELRVNRTRTQKGWCCQYSVRGGPPYTTWNTQLELLGLLRWCQLWFLSHPTQ